MTRPHEFIPGFDNREDSMNQPRNSAANADHERKKKAAREALDRGDKEKIEDSRQCLSGSAYAIIVRNEP